MKKRIYFLLAIVSAIATAFAFTESILQNQNEKIVGVWIPDESGYDYRIEVSEDGIWKEYYNKGQTFTSYEYTIESNPECSVTVPVEPGLYYIKLTEKPGPLEQVSEPLELCYELDIVSDERLSLILIGGASYQPTTFKRFKL